MTKPLAVTIAGAVSLGFLCFGLITACNTITTYDQAAYAQAVNLKVDTLALMDKASGTWEAHTGDISKLNIAMAKGCEYDKNRPRNDVTGKLWEVLLFKSPSDPRNGIW